MQMRPVSWTRRHGRLTMLLAEVNVIGIRHCYLTRCRRILALVAMVMVVMMVVVVMMRISFLSLLLTGSQHIIKRVMTNALPVNTIICLVQFFIYNLQTKVENILYAYNNHITTYIILSHLKQ